MSLTPAFDPATLHFDPATGLLPVVAQDARTGEVLMLAYANREALERTLAGGTMWYFSRRRGRLWNKGETSGHVQRVVSLHADCDGDAVVARVIPDGPSCHTGQRTCFGGAASPTLAGLDDVISARRAALDGPAADPARTPGYTARLLVDRNLRLKKLGEEAVELALAAAASGRADGPPAGVSEEAADLLYHLLVACRGEGVTLADVLAVLERRRAGR